MSEKENPVGSGDPAWDEAALWFCSGFDTSALNGSSLGDVVEALRELRDYAGEEITRGGAHHDQAWAKAADILARLQPTKPA